MDDKLKEACGVFGIYGHREDVARVTFFGLFALQHRGQESAGIVTSDGSRLAVHKSMGQVAQVFTEDDLHSLPGHIAIGHTRYSTTGSSKIFNAQPVVVDGQIALGHNGNLTNAAILREELLSEGYVFRGTSDSEMIAHLFNSGPGRDQAERIRLAMRRLIGAFSIVALTKNALYALRDPLGVRPLCLGKLSGSWVVASESCALDTIEAQFIREIEPGEIVKIDDGGVESFPPTSESRRALCMFEYIYFARPDSIINDRLVHQARMSMGRALAREHPADADIVIGVPDSGTPAAIGYAEESGIPFREGLVKNRYIGRTFIQPEQRLRDIGISLKYNPLPEVLADKSVAVVDDSIVRGSTTKPIVSLLRRGGAREVHVRIHAPPMVYPCYLGLDTARRNELIAAKKTVDEIREFIGADSLGYLSLDNLMDAIRDNHGKLCQGCFTGQYPVPVQLEFDKLTLEMR